ncbi:MAG: Thioredoxin [uncultured Acidimicrobiales bacterium]|uniref:Thioredoxin n=1 Tax=uncultured Acidimicrobiales bacterium TaxID=310071 RepID=A0A6J4IBF4_9ACTN|nr:MAG: Thioredoxin [uncultured Acidimicrobiales bacterium]
MGAHTITITDDTFDEEVKGSSEPVLVDFWAEWCGPCRMIAPVLEEIAVARKDTLKVAKLNIDDNLAITTRFDVQSIPTLILFKDGEPVARVVGARGRAALEEEIDRHV